MKKYLRFLFDEKYIDLKKSYDVHAIVPTNYEKLHSASHFFSFVFDLSNKYCLLWESKKKT